MREKKSFNCEMVKDEDTINVTLRIPREAHNQIADLCGKLGVNNKSQMYRWIIEAYLEVVTEDGDEIHLPAVVTMARAYLHNSRKKFTLSKSKKPVK
tara:strand:- start:693 stop:983 length:291 start_codon:yes stop_codon:yes gene_type:complete